MNSELPNDHWHNLAKKGKDKWNEWAKAELNKDIVKRQRVEFRDVVFDNIDFQNFIFPSNTFFVKCRFNERVMFRGAVFHDTLSVSETIFHKIAVFDQCKFHGHAFFWENVVFCDTVYFNQSFFRKNINFSNAEIQKSVNLGRTVILGGLHRLTLKRPKAAVAWSLAIARHRKSCPSEDWKTAWLLAGSKISPTKLALIDQHLPSYI